MSSEISQMVAYVEPWREVLVVLHSVVTWEKDWYPALTAGCLTTFYLILYSADPTTLTLLSLMALIITLLDYLTPLIISRISPNSWSSEKEKKLERLCRAMLNTGIFLRSCRSTFQQTKTTRPAIHFAATVSILVASAFIGSKVSGMFLSYMILMILLMLPGLISRGLLAQYCHGLVTFVEERVKGKKKE